MVGAWTLLEVLMWTAPFVSVVGLVLVSGTMNSKVLSGTLMSMMSSLVCGQGVLLQSSTSLAHVRVNETLVVEFVKTEALMWSHTAIRMCLLIATRVDPVIV